MPADELIVMQDVHKVYLLNQDYSFGQQVASNARAMLAQRARRVSVVGDELHPVGKVRDFSPYVAKIKDSGADTVITGNWGNDLTLLVRAAREAGLAGTGTGRDGWTDSSSGGSSTCRSFGGECR